MVCTVGEIEVSFPTVKEYIAHEKSGHQIMPKVEAPKPIEAPKTPDSPPSSTPVPKKEPIILEYRYKGTHDCGNDVDTILMEVGDSTYVLAYCNSCRVKVTDQRVIPIEKQGELLKEKGRVLYIEKNLHKTKERG